MLYKYILNCKGTIVAKEENVEYSSKLWKKNDDGEPFSLMFYIKNREMIHCSFYPLDVYPADVYTEAQANSQLIGFRHGSHYLDETHNYYLYNSIMEWFGYK